MNRWGLKAEDTVRAVGVDGLLNCAGVDGTDGWLVVGLWHGVVVVQEGRE